MSNARRPKMPERRGAPQVKGLVRRIEELEKRIAALEKGDVGAKRYRILRNQIARVEAEIKK
jgi:uncharacterized small protein (DUF1192 family)